MAWLLPQRGEPLCCLISSRESREKTVLFLNGDERGLCLESVLCAYALTFERVIQSVRIRVVNGSGRRNFFKSDILEEIGASHEFVREAPELIEAVGLPSVLVEGENRVIAGLCSAVRYLLLLHGRSKILGFRAACLASCAQVSLWTAFCEREVPSSLLDMNPQEEPFEFPQVLLILESQLRQPVRTHNDKRCKNFHKVDELSHDFVEGIAMTLSDLLLFFCVHQMFLKMRRFSFNRTIPRVILWYKRMLSLHDGNAALDILKIRLQSTEIDTILDSIECVNCDEIFPQKPIGISLSLMSDTGPNDPTRLVEEISVVKTELGELELPSTCLYSQSKANSETRIRVKRKDCAPLMAALEGHQIVTNHRSKFSAMLKWDDLPEDAKPESGGVPEDRMTRKRQQISNVVNAVMSTVNNKNEVIVDFCSGGGHVAIVLAYLLPECKIIMIENKYESIYRACERVKRLGLKNISFCQCNLDKFGGDFDVGVSLHACGGATDLVIKKCVEAGASIVSVPCCYGGIGRDRALHRDLQDILKELKPNAFTELCHMADRNENVEGNILMEHVDSDRVQFIAETNRYQDVSLSKLYPLSCTPKNNIIVASAVR